MRVRLYSLLVSSLLIIINCDNIDNNELAKKITQKVCRITKKAIHNQSDKAEVIKSLEKKFKKIFHKTGIKSNIDFVMNGVRMMVMNNNFKVCDAISNQEPQEAKNNTNSEMKVNLRTNEGFSKSEMINEVTKKIDKLVKTSIEKANTPASKRKLFEIIKKRVISSFKSFRKGGSDYSNIISDGMEIAWKKAMLSNPDFYKIHEPQMHSRKQETFEDNVTKIKNSRRNGYNSTSAKQKNSTVCEKIVIDTCEELGRLNEFKCSFDDTTFPIQRICDGVMNCPDGSDESDCAKQATKRVQWANDVVQTLNVSRHCFTRVDNESMLAHQINLLTNTVQKQIDFIEKFGEHPPNDVKAEQSDTNVVKNTSEELAQEVFEVISSFVFSLKSTLCEHIKQTDGEEMEETLRYNSNQKENDNEQYSTWSSSKCECIDQLCSNKTCREPCVTFCHQKYMFGKLNCRATHGGNVVPLDELCDGKYDCFDETDELDCHTDSSMSKFEASGIYANVLKLIQTKASKDTYRAVRPKLITLYSTIKELEAKSRKAEVNKTNFKSIRNKCFELLTDVFVEYLDTHKTDGRRQDFYDFVESVNEKLIVALKKSNTGNDRVAKSTDCFCRGTQCMTLRCSKTCVTTCAVKPKLTSYICSNSSDESEAYVPIEAVCNGKPNCPNSEDEKDCKQEICMSHNLARLRSNIDKIGEKRKGAILWEVLQTWKKKVTSTLIYAEKHERATPQAFKGIVNTILEDWLSTYTSLEAYPRTMEGEHVLKMFTEKAQEIIEELKKCTL